MFRFYCFVTGDDHDLLMADTPESRKKVAALATMVFIPVIIWFINGLLLVSLVMKGSWGAALMVASILGVLIFLIEKNIVMARTTASIKRFRYALGVVIAILGAVFLDEVIFKQDVDQKMKEIVEEQVQHNNKQIDQKYEPELNQANADVDSKYLAWQQSADDAKHEADGTGGSGNKGVHSIARLKMAIANTDQDEYTKALNRKTEIEQRRDAEKVEKENEIKASFSENALLGRIKGLFHLVFSDFYMGIIYCLFTLFIAFMELLVIFMKSAWPETNYERKLQLIEEIGRRRMEKILQADMQNYNPAKVSPAYKAAHAEMRDSHISLYN